MYHLSRFLSSSHFHFPLNLCLVAPVFPAQSEQTLAKRQKCRKTGYIRRALEGNIVKKDSKKCFFVRQTIFRLIQHENSIFISMKATTLFPLLLMLLISACYVDVYEIGKSSSSNYYYSETTQSSSSSQKIDVLLDSVHCEKQSYKVVEIGSQTWIAQNLNEMPKSGNSWCYGMFDENCNINGYGRLYDWDAAKTVCSTCGKEWVLPSKGDYEILSDVDADLLRATSVWHAAFNGWRYEDESRGPFMFRDNYGYWWSSTENGQWAYYSELIKNGVKMEGSYEKKTYGLSVRCIKK